MAGKGQSGALTDMQLARKIRQLIYFVGLLHTSLSLSLSPSLSLDFYPTRIVSKCGPHILSLSLSLDMPLLWGDRGERRAVKSFMNFKQGPRIEEPRDHFSFFRCHVGERGMEREMDRDGSRVNRAEIRRGEKGRGGDDKLQ